MALKGSVKCLHFKIPIIFSVFINTLKDFSDHFCETAINNIFVFIVATKAPFKGNCFGYSKQTNLQN